MIRSLRLFLWLVIGLSVASLFISLVLLIGLSPSAGKWFSTSSALVGVSAAIQLEVSGFFDRIFEQYADEEKYPYGPPSHINREITDVPDSSTLQMIRHFVLFEPKTGFWFAVTSLFLSIPGIWIT